MPNTICSVDFETRGTVELKRTGVYVYAAHHDTSPWCLGWAFDDEEPAVWNPSQPFPERIIEHIRAGGEMRAFNAAFERIVWRDCLTRIVDVPVPNDSQWFCTMAESCAMSLPRSLEQCAEVLKVGAKKDMAGNRLMMQMSRPRKFAADDVTPIWWDDADRLAKLYAYCANDVRVERLCYKKLNRLGKHERGVYLLDQKMNDRGVALDYSLVEKAKKVAERETRKQNAILSEATKGAVTKVTQVARLKEWLAALGIDEPDLAKATLAGILDDTSRQLPAPVAAALGARLEAAKSSVAKLDAMLDWAGRDNRLRGMFLYHGASTGRWSGKGPQPQNFPRGLDVSHADLTGKYIPEVQRGDPSMVVTLNTLSAMLRSMFVAPAGRHLYAADFAAIEARGVAWVSGDENLLRQFDGPPGYAYKAMGGAIYGCSPDQIVKPSEQYQLAKNTMLGCGYQMGWKHFAETTGTDEKLAKHCVATYRGSYPSVVQTWDDLNTAAITAVQTPQAVYKVGPARFTFRRGFLYIVLPSGRPLCYANARIEGRPMPWDDKDVRPSVAYDGIDSYTRKWSKAHLYGGALMENVVSGICRDLLAEAMQRVESAGFPVVMTVHDEVVSEGPAGQDDVLAASRFLALVKEVPSWAAGFPVDAEGWNAERYRK